MSLFDTDHIVMRDEDVTAGPEVGWGEAIAQGFEQQYRVDSPLSLEYEVQDSWLRNLRELERATGERYEMPENLSDLQNYMRELAGEQVEWSTATSYEDPVARRAKFEKANARIKELADPRVKSFEQVVAEVFQMQQEVEGRTADVTARGDFWGQMIGAIGGSFTTRDPLNIYSLTMGGVGRNAAMRIASEMAVGGAVVAATDVGYVMPNRERAGLPERSLLTDVIAGTLGAGVVRGAFELGGAGFRSLPATQRAAALRELEEARLSEQDIRLQALLETMPNSSRARAGLALLDDAKFIERVNPYGVGDQANARFEAELREVAEAVSGVPMTAVARVLPPVPFEHIETVADFAIVKEQAPAVWAKLEETQAAVRALDDEVATSTAALQEKTIIDAVRTVDPEAADKLVELEVRVNDPNLPEPAREAADLEAQAIITRVGEERIARGLSIQEKPSRHRIQRARNERRAAYKRYRQAYKEVEAEAGKLKKFQAAVKGRQQADAVDLLGYATSGRPFVGPLLRYDAVEARVDEIARVNEVLADPETVRMTLDEETGLVDVGGRAMPEDFVVPFDDGDLAVRAIIDDFAEDAKLEAAVRSCAI